MELSWYDRVLMLLVALGLSIAMGLLHKKTSDKLDQIIDNWNDRQTECEQGGKVEASVLYVYDEESGTVTPLRARDFELPVKVARALCAWVEWMRPDPEMRVGLAPMLAKACGGKK